jgi:hypothetical protein
VVEVMLSRQLERIRQQGIETVDRITGHASPASIRQRHRVGDRTGDPRTAACPRGPYSTAATFRTNSGWREPRRGGR